MLHDDASGSISASIERNLLQIAATDIENVVDRFDVRLLLDEVPQAPSARCAELQTIHSSKAKMIACRIQMSPIMPHELSLDSLSQRPRPIDMQACSSCSPGCGVL